MEQKKNVISDGPELFNLYKSLVRPFWEYEKRKGHKQELERELKWNQQKVARETQRTFKSNWSIGDAFGDTLKWSIPFLIVFYIILNVIPVNEENLFYYFDQFLTDIMGPLVDGLHDLIFKDPDAGALADMAEIVYYLFTGLFLCFGVLPCLVFLFPLMIVKNVVSEARRVSREKEESKNTLEASKEACENYKKQLPQAEAAMQEAWKKIAPYMEYIPPDYRNSSALSFFSNSFFNAKVKNLKEAVILYDQYLHEQRMEESQRRMEKRQSEMEEAQRRAREENRAAMDSIYGQLDSLQDQIDSQEPVIINNYYN